MILKFIIDIISVSTPIVLALILYRQNRMQKQMNGRLEQLLQAREDKGMSEGKRIQKADDEQKK